MQPNLFSTGLFKCLKLNTHISICRIKASVCNDSKSKWRWISWQGAGEVVKRTCSLSYGSVIYYMIITTTYLVWGYRYTWTHVYTEPNFFLARGPHSHFKLRLWAALVPGLRVCCQHTEAPQASVWFFVCLPIKVLIPHSLLAENFVISALCWPRPFSCLCSY